MPTSGSLAIGLVYETHGSYPKQAEDPRDFNAEYEPESTIETLEDALRELGHTPVRLGHPHALLKEVASGELARRGLGAALCVAEGYGSRNREAWAPVLLEMAGVPALGSDALTLSLTLDKAWANERARAAGIPIGRQCSVASADAAHSLELPDAFPLFVKPRWEGTSKGIRRSSRVEDRAALVREVGRIVADYRQPALVEKFVAGPEYTVTVVGNDPPRAMPVLQRAIELDSGIGVHALANEVWAGDPTDPTDPADLRHETPGSLEGELEGELQRLALLAYQTFECLDFARLDFRLDPDNGGRPVFLEINPLPTFAIDGSFAILAELEGRSLTAFLADVFREGLERLQKQSQSKRGL
jgi:D-alanine-D-alanine ligase